MKNTEKDTGKSTKKNTDTVTVQKTPRAILTCRKCDDSLKIEMTINTKDLKRKCKCGKKFFK